MFITYILLFIFAILIWVALKRKSKSMILILVIILGLIVGAWYYLTRYLEAVGPECEENRKWTFAEYTIIEQRCIGFAGPPYYNVYLYKNGLKVDRLTPITDSTCIIKHKPNSEPMLTFDICKENKNSR